MRVIARRDDLLAAAQALAKIADRSSSMPMLANVLIRAERGELLLAATDLNLTGQWPIGATIKTEGAITVAAKPFVETLKGLPKGAMVNLSAVEQYLHVECKDKAFKLVGMAARDFPKLPALPAEWFSVSAPAMFGSFAAVVETISRDEARYHLNGACLIATRGDSTLTALSTDGLRLSRDTRDVGGSLPGLERVILPRPAVKLVMGLLRKHAGKVSLAPTAPEGVKIEGRNHGGWREAAHLHFRIDDLTVTARLIEAKFPPVDVVEGQAAQAAPDFATLNAGEFASAVRLASLCQTTDDGAEWEGVKTVNIALIPGQLRVSAGDPIRLVKQRWYVPRKTRIERIDAGVDWKPKHGKPVQGPQPEERYIVREIDEGPDHDRAKFVDCEGDAEYEDALPDKRRIVARGGFMAVDMDCEYSGPARIACFQPGLILRMFERSAEGNVEIAIPAEPDPNAQDQQRQPMRVKFGGREALVMSYKDTPPAEAWPPVGGMPYLGERPAAAPAKTRKVKAPAPPPAPFEDEPTLVDPPVPVERPSVVAMTCGECVAGVVRIPYNGGMREMYCNCWYGQQRAQLAA